MHGCRLRTTVVAVAVLAALAVPAPAHAHARVVRVRPANGAVLASPPAAFRVRFDDSIRPGPGVEAVRNGGGSILARPPYVSGGGRELVVPLRGRLGAGDYSVRWSVISDDGHNERGVTTFAVGSGRAPPRAALSAGGTGRDWNVAARLLLFGGVLLAAGAALSGLFVGRPAPRRLSLLVAGGCASACTGAVVLAARGTSGTRFALVEEILAAVAASGAALAVLGLRSRAARLGAYGAAVALAPLPTFAGHALDASQSWWSAPADVVHVLSASVWVGGIASLALVGPRAFAATARRFSTLALVAVAALGVTGILRALGELTAVSQLWSTGYGRTLLVKSGLLAALVLVGARNRYRLLPRADRAAGAARLRESIGLELVLLAAVVGAVAVLTELPPGRSAGAAEPAPRGPRATRPAVLPRPGGVVLARQHGELAVALSARRAGERLELVATVLGPNGLGLDGLPVRFSIPGGRSAGARACGAGCYAASLAATEASAVDVVVSGRPLRFALPARARSAAALVGRAAAVFMSLRSLVIDERLASGPTNRIRTRFELVAPDRLAYRISGGEQAIVIGGRRWARAPNGRWRRSPQSPLRLPSAPWTRVRDARLLGAGVDRGRPVWRVSFLDPTVPAWFELAIDRRTLRTLDARMTAAAHFMRDRYSRFNAPLRIRPPGS